MATNDWLDDWEVGKASKAKPPKHAARRLVWQSVLWGLAVLALGGLVYVGVMVARDADFGGTRRVVPVPVYRQAPLPEPGAKP